jgi:uncharacterized membrane protein YkvA (DUF1232 family)
MNLLRLVFVLKREVPRVLPLMRDARVPMWAKCVSAVAALLIVSPLDVFGDIPGLGLIDDAVLLVLVTHLFVRFAESRLRPVPVRNVTPNSGLPIRR